MWIVAYIILPLVCLCSAFLYWPVYVLLLCLSILIFSAFNLFDNYFITTLKHQQRRIQILLFSLSVRFIVALFGIISIKKIYSTHHTQAMVIFSFVFVYYWLIYGIKRIKTD